MRKIVGICVLSLGILLLLYSGGGLVYYLVTTREMLIDGFKKNGKDATYYYKEDPETHLKKGRLVMGLFLVIGVGVVYGGYRLIKKGNYN